MGGTGCGLNASINLFHSTSLLSVLKMREGITHFIADWRTRTHARVGLMVGLPFYWPTLFLHLTSLADLDFRRQLKPSSNPQHTLVQMRHLCSLTCFATSLSALLHSAQKIQNTATTTAWCKQRTPQRTVYSSSVCKIKLHYRHILYCLGHWTFALSWFFVYVFFLSKRNRINTFISDFWAVLNGEFMVIQYTRGSMKSRSCFRPPAEYKNNIYCCFMSSLYRTLLNVSHSPSRSSFYLSAVLNHAGSLQSTYRAAAENSSLTVGDHSLSV